MPGLTLSRKAKEAIKFALAFSIVYYIALSVSWMNPYWAGLAVAMLSLVPDGHSIYKGVLRVAGTFPAIFITLLIYAISPQDRWLYMMLTASWIFFASYMLVKAGSWRYFWQAAAFITLVLLEATINDGGNVFEHIVARALETIMGVIVYTLVAIFLWPENNLKKVEQAAINSLSIQTKLFAFNAKELTIDENQNALLKLRASQSQALVALYQTYKAVGAENFRVRESFPLWLRFHEDSTALMKALILLQNSFAVLVNIDLDSIFPNIYKHRERMQERFEMSIKQFEEGYFEYVPQKIEIEMNHENFEKLNHFQKVALTSSLKTFKEIDELSYSLLKTSQIIMNENLNFQNLPQRKQKQQRSLIDFFVPDIDNLKSALSATSIVIFGFVLWVYFDPPGHAGWFAYPATVFLAVTVMPQMKVKKVVPIFGMLNLIALVVYVFILPQLTSYVGLGSVILIYMFLVQYYLPVAFRAFGALSIIMVISITNVQVYDFADRANTSLYMVIGMYLTMIFSYFLGSSRPEKVLLKLMNRYFRSAEFLLETAFTKTEKNLLQKIKDSFYKREIRTLPQKVSAWAPTISPQDFPENSAERTTRLIGKIDTLSYSIQEFYKTSQKANTTILSQETQKELLTWKKEIQETFKAYKSDLGKLVSKEIEQNLNHHVLSLEEYINKGLSKINYSKISEKDKETLFKLLADFQGLSIALLSYSQTSEQTNWNHWKEERFS